MKKIIRQKQGATFIELLLYIAIFLVLTPILLAVSILSLNQEKQHDIEKQINADSQFIIERIYDTISEAKQVDMSSSNFNDPEGKIVLTDQNDNIITIELNPDTDKVEITEGGVTSNLSSDNARVESLYFEKITDNINDPDIVLGVNIRMNITGLETYSPVQHYVVSANLERGDYDNDDSPDYLDKFPHNIECSGDADDDGSCDEIDNCVLAYNPFQEDFDEDGIGDVCDYPPFDFPAFNCNNDDALLALLDQHPPLSSSQLKQIFLSSSPLSPIVLQGLIDKQEDQNLMGQAHLKDIFVGNVKLPEDQYQDMLNMVNFASPHLDRVIDAHEEAESQAWEGYDPEEITYQTELITTGSGEEGDPILSNPIKFYDADYPLGNESEQKTDIFLVGAEGGSDFVTVTLETTTESDINDLAGAGTSFVSSLGFGVSLDRYIGNAYMFRVTSINNDDPLVSVQFDFGAGSNVIDPTTDTYTARRYSAYCAGGCAENCGDTGTGIVVGSAVTDDCYKEGGEYPEWCSKWITFYDDNSDPPAYVGGTQVGEETVYWEKTFNTLLNQNQIDNLKSITVGGEIAYQSIAQFFCDQLESSCIMKGNLTGDQNVQLYDWTSESWETVGTLGLDETISDQQNYEIITDDENLQRFIGGEDNRHLKARMQFHWEGIPDEGEENAPSFMLIDYFTLHLLW